MFSHLMRSWCPIEKFSVSLSLHGVRQFLAEVQREASLSGQQSAPGQSEEEDSAAKLIRAHEPDPLMRQRGRLSFEGFARFMLDRVNFACTVEEIRMNEAVSELDDF